MDDEVLAEFAASASTDLGRLLNEASKTVNGAVFTRVIMGGHPEIRVSHLPVFSGMEAGGTRISVLATRAGVSRQAMGATVREIEALGYVRSRSDPHDARAVLVELTPLGVSFCREAIDATRELNHELDLILGKTRADRLRVQLHQISTSDALTHHTVPPAP